MELQSKLETLVWPDTYTMTEFMWHAEGASCPWSGWHQRRYLISFSPHILMCKFSSHLYYCKSKSWYLSIASLSLDPWFQLVLWHCLVGNRHSRCHPVPHGGQPATFALPAKRHEDGKTRDLSSKFVSISSAIVTPPAMSSAQLQHFIFWPQRERAKLRGCYPIFRLEMI